MHHRIQTTISLAFFLLCAFSACLSNTAAQSQATPDRVLEPLAAKLEPSRKIVYKSVGNRDLELHVFQPEGHDPAKDRRPCILIIHGGGWAGGEPRVYYTIADHYAKKGMLAISLQYRLINAKTGVTVFDCVKDGRSAVRWLRAHAPALGIDSKRIAVSGGSAGGHVALGTAVFENGPDVDETTDDLSVSCVPDLLISLNPVIDTSADGYGQGKIGQRWRALSPLHHVKQGLPPMLICHSTGDTVTPYAGAARFVELSKAAGNDCRLFTFEGGRHGWFIFDLDHYAALLRVMDDYLEDKGFLSQQPTPQRVLLWPSGAPCGDGTTETVDVPITVHRSLQGKANGTAVIICPGGGYGGLVTGAEGHGIAKWLTQHGIAGVVLEYRLPRGRAFVPLLDAQRAIRSVRANADKWGIKPDRIGIIGFSAGGHLAATAVTHFDAGDLQAENPIQRESSRPDFGILVYPVVSLGRIGHGGTRKNLLGPDPKASLIELFSNEKQVSKQTPPVYLTHAVDDKAVPVANSRQMHAALKAKGVPTEYLELPSGGHGLNGYKGPMWDAWQTGSLKWLRDLDLLR